MTALYGAGMAHAPEAPARRISVFNGFFAYAFIG
jgi:hypothetical protein